MNKTDLANLPLGTLLYHTRARNADQSPLRARVNGKLKTWKRYPEDFRLPMKHGLRDCFYITPSNVHEWRLTEAEAEETQK